MVYSRVPSKSIKIIRQIFSEYLMNEAEKVTEKSKKALEFVDELIRLNSKCVQLVEYCSNNFELEDERINKVRGMLSNNLTERGRKEANFDTGAKNLASSINHKFKVSYHKGGQESLG